GGGGFHPVGRGESAILGVDGGVLRKFRRNRMGGGGRRRLTGDREDGLWWPLGARADEDDRAAPTRFDRPPLDARAGTQRRGLASFDGNAPDVAAVDVALVGVEQNALAIR